MSTDSPTYDTTSATAARFDEAAHPRGAAGRFSEKTHDEPGHLRVVEPAPSADRFPEASHDHLLGDGSTRGRSADGKTLKPGLDVGYRASIGAVPYRLAECLSGFRVPTPETKQGRSWAIFDATRKGRVSRILRASLGARTPDDGYADAPGSHKPKTPWMTTTQGQHAFAAEYPDVPSSTLDRAWDALKAATRAEDAYLASTRTGDNVSLSGGLSVAGTGQAEPVPATYDEADQPLGLALDEDGFPLPESLDRDPVDLDVAMSRAWADRRDAILEFLGHTDDIRSGRA